MKLNNVFSALVLASGLATFGAQADQGSGMGLGMTGFCNRYSMSMLRLNLSAQKVCEADSY
ncbi:hypothetical protein [Raoultella ornithinolytica]|uniref:hypothetical protein n=1 Tax=Raoultella ornithinolytica TaxID=54291 RepID=UPI001F1AB569|nr:hypothetical protein [Raoultella ornithinolytica]